MTRIRQTSIEAYNYIKDSGMLSKLRWMVYDYVYKNGPLTQREVINALSDSRKETSGRITSRFSELRRMEAFQEVGTTECKFTGRKVLLWDVTDRVPKVITYEEKLLERIKNTREKLIRLENELNARKKESKDEQTSKILNF